MKYRTISYAAPLALASVWLAGCSSVSEEQFAERYLIEFQSATGFSDEQTSLFTDFAEGMAEDADEYCGDELYASLMFNIDYPVGYAWEVSCSMYYDDRFTDEHRRRVIDMVLAEATDG